MTAATVIAAGLLVIALVVQNANPSGFPIVLAAVASVAGVIWLLCFLGLYLPGIALLVGGRARQRGRVVGQGVALAWAMAGLPIVGALTLALGSLLPSDGSADVIGWTSVALLCLLTLLVPVAAAWAIWGKRRRPSP